MRLLLSSAVVFALAVGFSACSEDAKDDPSADAGSGGSGSGGRVGAGGTPGTGGYDPALALQCGVDAGANECRVCLAAVCCDAAKACFGDATCTAALETLQTCTRNPAVTDKSGCYSAFGLTIRVDGDATHEPLLLCILSDCTSCGAPQLF